MGTRRSSYEDVDQPPPPRRRQIEADYGGPPEQAYYKTATRGGLVDYSMTGDVVRQVLQEVDDRRKRDPQLRRAAEPSELLLKEMEMADPSIFSHPKVLDLLMKKFGAPKHREASSHMSLAATTLKFAADNQNRKNAILNKSDSEFQRMVQKIKRKSPADTAELMAWYKDQDWKPSDNKVLNDRICQPGRSINVNRVERMVTARFSLGDSQFVPTAYGPCSDQTYRMFIEYRIGDQVFGLLYVTKNATGFASVSPEERDAYIPIVEKGKEHLSPIPVGAIGVIHTQGSDESPYGLLYTGHLYRCNISDYMSANPTVWDKESLVRYHDLQLDNAHRRKQLASLLVANNISDDEAESLRTNDPYYHRVPGTSYKHDDQRDLTKHLSEVSPQLNHSPLTGATSTPESSNASRSGSPASKQSALQQSDSTLSEESPQPQDPVQLLAEEAPVWSHNGVRQIITATPSGSGTLLAAATLDDSIKATKRRQKEDQERKRLEQKDQKELHRVEREDRKRKDRSQKEEDDRKRARQATDIRRDPPPPPRRRIDYYADGMARFGDQENRYNDGAEAQLRAYRDPAQEYDDSTIAPSRGSRATQRT